MQTFGADWQVLHFFHLRGENGRQVSLEKREFCQSTGHSLTACRKTDLVSDYGSGHAHNLPSRGVTFTGIAHFPRCILTAAIYTAPDQLPR